MSNHQQILRIYVKFDDLGAGIKVSSHDNLGRSNRWVPRKRSQATCTLKKKSKSSVIVIRTQFPLTLSYACTVHNVQEKSLSKAVVNLNLCKQKAFQLGKVYVTLSRITNFERMYLTGSYDRALTKTNVAAKGEYGQLKLHQRFTPILKTLIYYKPFEYSFLV